MPPRPTPADITEFMVCADVGRLRRFATAIGEARPLYVDEDAARQAGFRSLPLPPTFLFGLSLEPGEPFPWFPDVGFELPRVLHGEQLFTYHAVPCAGDRLNVRHRITEVYDKPERGLRFAVRETRIVSEDGETVADLRAVFIQPAAARPSPPHKPTASTAHPGTVRNTGGSDIAQAELRLPPITRETLAQFAEPSGDLNPIHLDPAFARNAGFEDVFAQGMLSAAYLARLLTSRVPQDLLRGFRIRFTGRTRLGEAPICTLVEPADGHPQSGERRIALRVANQAGEERLVGEARVSSPR